METFGYKLRSVREDEGLSLEDAASITGIRFRHLQALERDDYDALPDELSVKGYLRTYSEILHVNPELMIEDYLRERESQRPARAEGETEVVVEHTPGGSKVAGATSRSRIPLLLTAAGLMVMLAILGSWWVVSQDTAEAQPPRSEPNTAASPARRNASAVWPTIPAVVEKSNAIAAVETEPPTEILADTVRETTGMNIPDHGVGTAVESRQLVGENDRFTEGMAVWFWTRVEGGSGQTIHHVWLREGVEATRLSLKLGGSPWRTYSSKTLWPESAGNWAVEARDETGRVLARREFLCVPL